MKSCGGFAYNWCMYIIKNSALYRIADGSEQEIVSQFAVEKVEAEKHRCEKQAWKNAGNDNDDRNQLFSRTALWGAKPTVEASFRPVFKFCAHAGNRLYYILAMSRSHGLFYYDLDDKKEMRLFHREEFSPSGFFLEKDGRIITTQNNRDGSVGLVRINEEGRKVQELTGGDCIDEHPWVSGHNLFYQTSGLARTADGHLAARSASAIARLDFDTGSVETVKEDCNIDYLLPKTDLAGNLYFIQRPHLGPGQSAGFLSLLKEILLFPYRLLVAIFGFLNIFSMIFGKKPLMSAGGPEYPAVDLSHQFIHGQLVDAAEASRREGRQVAVNRDWKLIKRSPDGKEQVIGTNVIWFDIDAEGRLFFTDGFRISDSDNSEIFRSDQLITFMHFQ